MVTLKDEEKKVIFQNIGELEQVHKELLNKLLESVDGNCNGKKLGDIFLDFKERYREKCSTHKSCKNFNQLLVSRFLKYGEYCSNLSFGKDTLDSLCREKQNVANEVKFCEESKWLSS